MIAHMDDHFLRSPVCDVVWEGFRSTTVDMQRAGWEFALQQVHDYRSMHDAYTVVFRHRESGWTGRGEIRGADNEFYRYSTAWMYRARDFGHGAPPRPMLVVQQMTNAEDRMFVDYSLRFTRIDMSPGVEVLKTGDALKGLHEFGVFRPWKPQAEDIIVEPATVSSLLDQIKRLQAPELAAIRQQNRARDARHPREEVVCQVIQLAA